MVKSRATTTVPPPFVEAAVAPFKTPLSDDALLSALSNFHVPHNFERSEERNLSNWSVLLDCLKRLLIRRVKANPVQIGLLAVSEPQKESARTPNPEQGASHARGSAAPRSRSNSGDNRGWQNAASHAGSPSDDLVLLALRTSLRLVRNASHDTRHTYDASEQLTMLLADTSRNVVLAALEILYALHQRSQRVRAPRALAGSDLISRLFIMTVGYGGREVGLGLAECCTSNLNEPLPATGASVTVEFARDGAAKRKDRRSEAAATAAASRGPTGSEAAEAAADRTGRLTGPANRTGVQGTGVSSAADIRATQASDANKPETTGGPFAVRNGLHVPDVRSMPKDERVVVQEFAAAHDVPKEMLFALLIAHRRATAFVCGRESRVQNTRMRMLAIATLGQIQPQPSALSSVFSTDQELISDLVTIVKADAADGLDDIPEVNRILALKCLSVASLDRVRLNVVETTTGVGSHHGVLPSLVRAQVSQLLASSKNPGVQAQSNVSMGPDAPESQAGESEAQPVEVLQDAARTPSVASSTPPLSVHFAEALLGLVHGIVTGSSATVPPILAGSGALGSLVPLIGDRDPSHTRVVAQAIRAMESIMSAHGASYIPVFMDFGGLTGIVDRIVAEVDVPEGLEEHEPSVIESCDDAVEATALAERGENPEFYELLGTRPLTPEEAIAHPAPSSSAASRGQLPHSQWTLLRGLFRILGQVLSGATTRTRDIAESRLPHALRQIIARPFHYGGSLFHIAASTAAEIAHSEPTVTSHLVKAGISRAVVRSVDKGLPPSSDSNRSIPTLLDALSLAPAALAEFVEARPLQRYLFRLASPFYSRAMQGETPVHIGNSLDELLRHYEPLRNDGSDAMLGFLRSAATFVTADVPKETLPPADESRNAGSSSEKDGADSSAKHSARGPGSEEEVRREGSGQKRTLDKSVSFERLRLSVANHAARMAGLSQMSSDQHCAIVRRDGLEHILQLRSAAAFPFPPVKVSDGESGSMPPRMSPSPATTISSLINCLRCYQRHGRVVLRSIFDAVRGDAIAVLRLGAELKGAWLEQEEEFVSASSEGGANVLSPPENDIDVSSASPSFTPAETVEERQARREELARAVGRLRVDVMILAGFCRTGSGSSSSDWQDTDGLEIATLVSVVERAARWHISRVYAGISLRVANDDLTASQVSASADPALRNPSNAVADEVSAALGRAAGMTPAQIKACACAFRGEKLPPEPREACTQTVGGFAWGLVTFVVAVQRLYTALARSVTLSSRRFPHDSAQSGSSSRPLAATLGRILAMHLKSAESLWEHRVLSCGSGNIVAAWDYIRGVLIEIKVCMFDESRPGTHMPILRAFLAAGGGYALETACKPGRLVSDVVARWDDLKDKEATTEGSAHLAIRKSLETTKSLLETSAASRGALSSVGMGRLILDAGAAVYSDTLGVAADESNESAKKTVGETDAAKVGTDGAESPAWMSLPHPDQLNHMREALATMDEEFCAVSQRYTVARAAGESLNTLMHLMRLLSRFPGVSWGASYTESESDAPFNNVWPQSALQRTAQAVSLAALNDFLEPRSRKALVLCENEGSLTGPVPVLQAISSMFLELSKTEERRPLPSFRLFNDRDPPSNPLNLQNLAPPAPPDDPDPEQVARLVEMGFSEEQATDALRQVAPAGVDYAADWLFTHMEDSNNEEDGDEGDGQREASDDEAEAEGSDGNTTDEELTGRPAPEAADDTAPSGEHVAPTGAGDDVHASTPQEAVAIPAADAVEEAEAVENPDAEMPDAAEHQADEDLESRSDGAGDAASDRDRGSTGDARIGRSARSEQNACVEESEPIDNVPLDTQPEYILRCSMRSELSDLKKSMKDTEDAVFRAVRASAVQISGEVDGQYESERALSLRALDSSVAPTSKAVYVAKVTDMFSRLDKHVQVSISAIEDPLNAVWGPASVTDVLVAMEDSELMTEKQYSEYATRLRSTLPAESTLVSSTLDAASAPRRNYAARLTALWLHHGGWKARHAVESCHVCEWAVKMLETGMEQWEGLASKTNLENDTIRPIENLSLHEPAPEGAGNDPEKNGFSKGRRSPDFVACYKGLPLLASALLILDAYVRSASNDHIEKLAEEHPPRTMEEESPIRPDDLEYVESTPLEAGGGEGGDDDEIQPDTEDKAMVIDTPEAAADNKDVQSFANKTVQDLSDSVAPIEQGFTNLLRPNWVSESTDADSSDPFGAIARRSIAVCLRALRVWPQHEVGDALTALLQLTASLTTVETLASEFCDQGGVESLLAMPQVRSARGGTADVLAIRVLVQTIVRHAVEDRATLASAMRVELRNLLKSRHAHGRDHMTSKSLLAAAGDLIKRHPGAFLDAITSIAQCRRSTGVVEFLPRNVRRYRDEASASEAISPHVTKVIGLLVEALGGIKARFGGQDGARSAVVKSGTGPNDGTATTSVRAHAGISMAGAQFLLEVILELVSIFPTCARALVAAPAPEGTPYPTAVDFLLQEILTYGQEQALKTSRFSRSMGGLFDITRDVFATLCSQPTGTYDAAVMALVEAADVEAKRASPRATHIKVFAACVSNGLPNRALCLLARAGLANNLLVAMGNLDMADRNVNEVITRILHALNAMGRAPPPALRQAGDISDEEADPRAAAVRNPDGTFSRVQIGRRQTFNWYDEFTGAPVTFNTLTYALRNPS